MIQEFNLNMLMSDEFLNETCNVTAIVTAMTEAEQQFLFDTLGAVMSDARIAQVILCVEEHNTWLSAILGDRLNDPRLEVMRLPLAFVGSIRNQALTRVRTPWVAYCDGDDLWCAGKISQQYLLAKANHCDFVGADHYLVNEGGDICAFALSRYIPMPSSWLVRTEIMKRYPFDESLRTGSDGEWWLRTHGLVKKLRCPKVLLKYRVRSGSLSQETSSKQRKTKFVTFASQPLIKGVIYCFSWCIWKMTQHHEYIWLKQWGSEQSDLQHFVSST